MGALSIDERRRGDETELVLSGELDLSTAGALSAALASAAEHGPTVLALDVAELSFCDSTGLRALLSSPGPDPLVLRCVGPQLGRLLDLTETRDRFRIE